MTRPKADTEELLQRAAEGDTAARQQLFVRHQHRLRQMVAVRMDRRLAARVDPSDLVQEALMDAHRKLNDYLRDRPLPFYPWLRRLAWERLLQLHRRHLHADRRSVLREEPMALPDESALQLANRLEAPATGPSAASCANAYGRPWPACPIATAKCWCFGTWSSSPIRRPRRCWASRPAPSASATPALSNACTPC